MEDFTPVASTLGGLMIGAAAALLLVTHGRIAGISGIAGGILRGPSGERPWRALFVAGLLCGGAIAAAVAPASVAVALERSWAAIVAAGVLVGLGTRVGSGCTSGHGVCGISRLSPRSLVATAIFMTSAALTVFVVEHAPGAFR